MIKAIKDLDGLKEEALKAFYPDKIKISVGMATCGLATGGQEVYDGIKSGINQMKSDIVLSKSGCLGFCQMEPVVDVWAPGMGRLTYKQMNPEKVKEIISLLESGEVKKDYLLCEHEEEILIDETFKEYDTAKIKDVPGYLGGQQRARSFLLSTQISENNGTLMYSYSSHS